MKCKPHKKCFYIDKEIILNFFLAFFTPFSYFCFDFPKSARKAHRKAPKMVKTGLMGIKCCFSLVFCPLFCLKIECEFKIACTVGSQRQKTEKNKNYLFFVYFPCINLSCLSGRPFEKPQKRSKTCLSGN